MPDAATQKILTMIQKDIIAIKKEIDKLKARVTALGG